jgi:hypothetical protein
MCLVRRTIPCGSPATDSAESAAFVEVEVLGDVDGEEIGLAVVPEHLDEGGVGGEDAAIGGGLEDAFDGVFDEGAVAVGALATSAGRGSAAPFFLCAQRLPRSTASSGPAGPGSARAAHAK